MARNLKGAAWLIAAASIAIQLPFLNRGISHYDEGSILAIADGLRHGEVLYRDRITTLAPLTYELMRLLFGLFGPHLLVGRILQALVFTSCTLLVFEILRRTTAPQWALGGSIAFLAVKPLGFPLWTMVNYSQIVITLWLAAVLAILSFLATRRRRWILLAGLIVGIAIITKQNIGALLGLTLASTLVVDAVYETHFWSVLSRVTLMLGGALLPVGAALAVYASQGALRDLLDRTVLDLASFVQPYAVPLPLFFRSLTPDAAVFAYMPTPLLHVSWENYLAVFSLPFLLPIGSVVLAIYTIPLLAITAGLWFIWRDFRSAMPSQHWSALVVLELSAGAAYASILYRADWSHLLNVSPPLLILCVLVLQRVLPPAVWAGRAAALALVCWLGLGVLMTLAIVIVYRFPVSTPRGRLLVPHFEADDTTGLLAYLDKQPQSDKILLMRAEPLYYFLSGRSIPGPLDLIMPGVMNGRDDERLAQILRSVDQVVYNPKFIATVRSPLSEYAPRTAATLLENFGFTDVIGPTACVLKPRENDGAADFTLVDIWANLDRDFMKFVLGPKPASLDGEALFQRTNWMMEPVVESTVQEPGVSSCFSGTFSIGPNEMISAIPMFHPDTWTVRSDQPQIKSGGFEISVTPDGERSHTVFDLQAAPSIPERPLLIPLDPFTNRRVAIQFCTVVTGNNGLKTDHGFLGWARPRIIRKPAHGTSAIATDFWNDFDRLQQVTIGDRPAEISREFEPVKWVNYRVLASVVTTPDLPTCFYEAVAVSAGDVLEALPLFHPDTWTPRLGDSQISAGAFQIDVLRPTPEHSERVYYAELPPGKPTEPVRIPLDAFADKRVTLHFCTAVRAERAPTAAHALLGWAEPRIVRAAAH